MRDKLNLLDPSVPLQKRYDDFLLWLSTKNHAIIEFMAQELMLSVSEVDVFNELGELDDDEFDIIDKIGLDIGHLFIILRAPKEVRKIIYSRSDQILKSSQPLTELKAIVDQNSDYHGIEDLVLQISGNCWKTIASYLRQRNIVSGTITTGFRSMLLRVGMTMNGDKNISEKQIAWIVRGLQHDFATSLRIFTNEIIETEFQEDYNIFIKIQTYIERYEAN